MSIYNFSAGPAMLPTAVMAEVKEELLDWRGKGISVMEISHRSEEFLALAEEAEVDIRALMNIPDNYKVLFLQGGARGQFSAVPLNLLGTKTTADYLNTGIWSKAALQEAQHYCKVNIVADAKDSSYTTIPEVASWHINPQAAYLHVVSNETINGVEFNKDPQVDAIPLVADMSSDILSRPIDVNKYALIYAGAQKNIGPAGLVLVIVREDMLDRAAIRVPGIINYKLQAEYGSMYNTPPTFAWYIAGLVFKWLRLQGGLKVMAERNEHKAQKLYNFIDASKFYHNPVDPKYRSRMNVIFTLFKPELTETFLKEADKAGLWGLRGHRLLGGMRASIYNAMPIAGVLALMAFMSDFADRYG